MSRHIPAPAVLWCAAVACGGSAATAPCQPVSVPLTATVLALTAAGTTWPLASFTFTQTFVTYSPTGCNSAAEGGTVTMDVASTAQTPQTLTYDVQGFSPDGVTQVWSYSGRTALRPSEKVNLGAVASSHQRIDAGIIRVRLN